MKLVRSLIAAAMALSAATAALADINVGVVLSLTGPGSGLGIPMQKQLQLFPKEIAGEKVNLIILDDASDPGKGVSNARRLITEDKVDLILGSSLQCLALLLYPARSLTLRMLPEEKPAW